MRFYSNEVWRCYRYSPGLWDRFIAGLHPMVKGYWCPKDIRLQAQILAWPIFRVLTQYPSYGMTPVALAAVTGHKPSEVWEQVKAEQANWLDWCTSTYLPVVDRLRAINELTRDGRVPISKLLDQARYIGGGGRLGQDFDEWLAERDKERSRVSYHRTDFYFNITRRDRKVLARAHTLGLTKEEAEPHLLSPEERAEMYTIPPPPPPPPPRSFSKEYIKKLGYTWNSEGHIFDTAGRVVANCRISDLNG